MNTAPATVQRAYVTRNGRTTRTLVSSRGHVYLPERGYWTRDAVGEVVKVPGEFRRWVDVPGAWIGEQPWWR